jgi:AraC family transcriptional regulator
MRERVDGTLPLSEMAEITHLSPYHFARTFWRITDVPPGRFIGALRRERAKETLLTTDLSLSEVCFEVGYNTSGPSPRASNNSSASVRAGYAPCPRIWPLPSKLLVRAFEPYPDRLRGGTGVPFRVAEPDLEGALNFVRLFTGTVPQGRPVASTLLLASGPHRLAPVPDGL